MEILFSKNSRKQLSKLNVRFQQKVLNVIGRFKNGEQVDIIKLKNKINEFRIRTGNYRIQLEQVDEGFLVTKIGKRENFYFVLI
jgi:mRNA-degrading endonuclease RelE of RelBE toxin-antitoxin system